MVAGFVFSGHHAVHRPKVREVERNERSSEIFCRIRSPNRTHRVVPDHYPQQVLIGSDSVHPAATAGVDSICIDSIIIIVILLFYILQY